MGITGGIQKTTGGWCILCAMGMLITATKSTAIKVAKTMCTLKLIRANFMIPAPKPNKNTVMMVPRGMLNNMPKPKAAMPDQKATSNK
tara:strand:+ start:11944 stop:12207 length:264 start_codon:yes stop_codon:yes gene_type:complete